MSVHTPFPPHNVGNRQNTLLGGGVGEEQDVWQEIKETGGRGGGGHFKVN